MINKQHFTSDIVSMAVCLSAGSLLNHSASTLANHILRLTNDKRLLNVKIAYAEGIEIEWCYKNSLHWFTITDISALPRQIKRMWDDQDILWRIKQNG